MLVRFVLRSSFCSPVGCYRVDINTDTRARICIHGLLARLIRGSALRNAGPMSTEAENGRDNEPARKLAEGQVTLGARGPGQALSHEEVAA